MIIFLAKRLVWKSHFLDNLKPLDTKLGLQRTLTWGFLILKINLNSFSILFTTPSVDSNNLVIGFKFLTDRCTSSWQSKPALMIGLQGTNIYKYDYLAQIVEEGT